MLLAAACDFDKDLQDPNNVQNSAADVTLLLNAVELDFADFFYAAQSRVSPLVRHIAMTGGYRYQNAYNPQNQDDVWKRAYADVLLNAGTVIKMGEELEANTHVGIAKVLTAYTYITLVDLFGDVPQAVALKGEENEFNPEATPGADVYAYAIGLLTEARTALAADESDVRDIYYGGDEDAWIALANTLELKAWVNISTLPARKSEADTHIAALLGGELIDEAGEDFTYKYSGTTVPDSRHPFYNQFYGVDEGLAGGYLGTGFMYELFRGKPDPTDPTSTTLYTEDIRWRYYFSRQAGSIEQINTIDPKAIGCTPGAPPAHYRAGDYPFCVFDPGFYGRDHGDASGTPPDGPVITAAGVFPAGGRADNADAANANFKSQTQRGQGADGAGILPIYMSYYTDFLRAEIAARDGQTATARTLMLGAVENSINYVKSFADSKGQSVDVDGWSSDPAWAFDAGEVASNPDCEMEDPDTHLMVPLEGADLMRCRANVHYDAFMTAVAYQFDQEPDKLKAVGRETWIATWGNGVEAYNSYRRTGGPARMQPTLQPGSGVWMRSLIYSANYVNLNQSAKQKNSDVVNRVFWDGNTEELN